MSTDFRELKLFIKKPHSKHRFGRRVPFLALRRCSVLSPIYFHTECRNKHPAGLLQLYLGDFCEHESSPEDKDITAPHPPNKCPLLEHSQANSEQLNQIHLLHAAEPIMSLQLMGLSHCETSINVTIAAGPLLA